MKKQLSIIILLFSAVSVSAENIVIPAGKTTVASYADAQVTVSDGADLHITISENPLVNSTITLQTENSWLFFDNIRPNAVIQNWLQYVKVGASQAVAVNGSNVRVEVYTDGTVIIPHSSSIAPLEVFDGQNFSENKQQYNINYHKTLGTMDNKIRSFKLKRGYMATLATMANGLGYSRVFIADDADWEVPVLQPELDQTVSFIRVTKWYYPSKKGWCSSGSGWANEIDLTASTWYYSWSADKDTKPNQEYVPIKQNTGWPSTSTISGKTNVNHLLGLNEPDRSDQANATVAQAIASMPDLLATGLRIGSPAIADNLTWLYNFMDECERLNYRVDFVAIHAYWGGSGGAFNAYTNGQVDINKWYNHLKEIHTRTGRPLWITEWNNGANWTNETWPSGTAAQEQKQLADLQKIIYMVDTCSFIERYSIYNWVEDKRAIVKGTNSSGAQTAGGTINQYLTPAGVFYRDNKSAMAFNRAKEVIPTLKLPVPEISSFTLTGNNTQIEIRLSSNDYSEIYASYLVEQKIDNGEFQQIDTVFSNRPAISRFSFPIDMNRSGQYFFRIRTVDRAGNISEPSKEVSFAVSPKSDIQAGKLLISNSEWTNLYFGQSFDANPITILGVPTNNNMSILMSNRIRNVSASRLQLRFFPWSYITSTFYTGDEMAYFFLPEGEYDFDGIKAVAATANGVNGEWKTVNLPEGFFTETPIIIPTQVSSTSASATSIHLRNVTQNGFEICLRHEDAKTYTIPAETVHFVAFSKGDGTIQGHKIRTGFVENIGHITVNAVTFLYDDSLVDPLIFAHKQTANNNFASNLRIISYSDTEGKIMNQIERSGDYTLTAPTDKAGWVVIETKNSSSSAIKKTIIDNLQVYSQNGYIKVKNNSNNFRVFDILGKEIYSKKQLPTGVYIVAVDGNSYKIIVK
jgi:hypothetical protein